MAPGTPLWPAGARLRAARRADLPAIVAIYNATIPSRLVTADLDPVTVEGRAAWFSAHSGDRRPLWVLETDAGEIVAWLSLQDFYGRPAYARTAEVSVYVREGARGQGLGSGLLRHAAAAAPSLGLDTLLAFVFAHNTPSLRLFTRGGFATWGHLPRIAVLDAVERDLVILGLRVGAAEGPAGAGPPPLPGPGAGPGL